MIIDKVCQVIRSQTIRFENYHVVQVTILEDHVSMQFVVNDRLALKGHGKTHRPGQSCCLVCCPLLFAEVTTVAVITRGEFFCLPLLSPLVGWLCRGVG